MRARLCAAVSHRPSAAPANPRTVASKGAAMPWENRPEGKPLLYPELTTLTFPSHNEISYTPSSVPQWQYSVISPVTQYDQSRRAYQAIRPERRRRPHFLRSRKRPDRGLPGPQWRRKDHHHARAHLLPAAHRGHGAGGRLRRPRAPDGSQEAHRLPAGDAAALPRNGGDRVPRLRRADSKASPRRACSRRVSTK